MNAIRSLVVDAWELGKEVDLAGVGYGRIHWGNRTDVSNRAPSYYRFLYGLAAHLPAKRALEIGTHWGGSAVATMRGMLCKSPNPTLVTIDVTNESDNFLPFQPESSHIIKLVADAADPATAKRIQSTFQTVDLIYIDAWKDAAPIVSSVKLYGDILSPKVFVLDDIRFTDSTKQAWSELQAIYPGRAVDCSEIIPEIRPESTHPGFGLISRL